MFARANGRFAPPNRPPHARTERPRPREPASRSTAQVPRRVVSCRRRPGILPEATGANPRARNRGPLAVRCPGLLMWSWAPRFQSQSRRQGWGLGATSPQGDESMTDEPTDAQIRFLAGLKYSGEVPRTKAEASFLIDGRKAGQDSVKLERELLRSRQKVRREWFKRERDYCRMEVRQARDSAGAIAGFRIRIGKRCDTAKAYHGAFVPTQVALKHPELLPPYEGICQH